ncbi:sugar ABC transporter substrate-binding protein [Uliginosibacterium sp. sgz301328]|uniref:ABC transporter substrate-binding protein n=1 Tax=Uliginosibacterium sp. sgz301328 TaxID=3243764 RepID=UPI00359EA53C
MLSKTFLATCVAALGCVATAQAAEPLQVWIRASNDSRVVYEKIGAAFEKKTGIPVEYFNATTDFEQRLARAATGNQLPDLIFDDAALMGHLVQMGIVDEIDRKSIKGGADLYDAAWESARAFNGKYYAVPTSAQSFALFIRKDWRTKLGLPQPKTWKDLEALAKAFTEKDPDGNGKADTYGFILPGSVTRGYTSWFLSSFLWQAGGDFIRKSGDGYKPSLDEPAAAETLRFMRGLICNKYTQPGAINATTADAIPSFRSGQTGMFFSGPYHIALFDKDPGKDTIEVVVPPAGPKGVATLAEGTSAFMMKTSRNKANAKQFMEYMISPEAQETGMAVGTTNIPAVRLSVNKNVDTKKVYNDERWALFADLYGKSARYVPQVPNWQPIRQTTADGFNRILADCNSNVEAELKTLNAKVGEELAKQNVLAK